MADYDYQFQLHVGELQCAIWTEVEFWRLGLDTIWRTNFPTISEKKLIKKFNTFNTNWEPICLNKKKESHGLVFFCWFDGGGGGGFIIVSCKIISSRKPIIEKRKRRRKKKRKKKKGDNQFAN